MDKRLFVLSAFAIGILLFVILALNLSGQKTSSNTRAEGKILPACGNNLDCGLGLNVPDGSYECKNILNNQVMHCCKEGSRRYLPYGKDPGECKPLEWFVQVSSDDRTCKEGLKCSNVEGLIPKGSAPCRSNLAQRDFYCCGSDQGRDMSGGDPGICINKCSAGLECGAGGIMVGGGYKCMSETNTQYCCPPGTGLKSNTEWPQGQCVAECSSDKINKPDECLNRTQSPLPTGQTKLDNKQENISVNKACADLNQAWLSRQYKCAASVQYLECSDDGYRCACHEDEYPTLKEDATCTKK